MTTHQIGRLMFLIPAFSVLAFVIGFIIWCAWNTAKISDDMEKHYGNPGSIKHRVHFFIWMFLVISMFVGACLSDL